MLAVVRTVMPLSQRAIPMMPDLGSVHPADIAAGLVAPCHASQIDFV